MDESTSVVSKEGVYDLPFGLRQQQSLPARESSEYCESPREMKRRPKQVDNPKKILIRDVIAVASSLMHLTRDTFMVIRKSETVKETMKSARETRKRIFDTSSADRLADYLGKTPSKCGIFNKAIAVGANLSAELSAIGLNYRISLGEAKERKRTAYHVEPLPQ
ncbi:hypothetical protein Ciccas_012483 [Cichlidogyrus casuarinus]|uniref:Uncharacterized protein n=1 Tax=Cichlidogyrus casuarinus TaxID=1844966 RepID=A0ABD2PN81_9PLAT